MAALLSGGFILKFGQEGSYLIFSDDGYKLRYIWDIKIEEYLQLATVVCVVDGKDKPRPTIPQTRFWESWLVPKSTNLEEPWRSF